MADVRVPAAAYFKQKISHHSLRKLAALVGRVSARSAVPLSSGGGHFSSIGNARKISVEAGNLL